MAIVTQRMVQHNRSDIFVLQHSDCDAESFQHGDCDVDIFQSRYSVARFVSRTKISRAELTVANVLSSGHNTFLFKCRLLGRRFLTCFIVLVSQHDHCQQVLQVGKRVSEEERWTGTRQTGVKRSSGSCLILSFPI